MPVVEGANTVEAKVKAVHGEVFYADRFDGPDPVVHVFRLGPRGYTHCTVEQARAMAAVSPYADCVVYESARVVAGNLGTRYVVFDVRKAPTHCFHGVAIEPGAQCDACEAEERGG